MLSFCYFCFTGSPASGRISPRSPQVTDGYVRGGVSDRLPPNRTGMRSSFYPDAATTGIAEDPSLIPSAPDFEATIAQDSELIPSAPNFEVVVAQDIAVTIDTDVHEPPSYSEASVLPTVSDPNAPSPFVSTQPRNDILAFNNDNPPSYERVLEDL